MWIRTTTLTTTPPASLIQAPRRAGGQFRGRYHASLARFGFFSVQAFHPELQVPPRTYFEQVLERIRQAEALGYESFWPAEHYFHPYGLNPAPDVLLPAAARETSRIRLGSAIAVLPFHHPIHLAEH